MSESTTVTEDPSRPPGVDLDADSEAPRRRYELEDTGFKEVPKRWRKFYRVWGGPGDVLAPNEVICPVCKVVIRSVREFRAGDRVYCMPCMSRMVVVQREDGSLEAEVTYGR
ncbi:MAG: hypothetical protein R2754_17100 [Microthrixaceae bacterium]